jgi:hypothetical protein
MIQTVRGRPASAGPRYESGKHREPGRGRPIFNRLRDHGRRLGLDPRLWSQLSLLAAEHKLTARQVEAGFTVANIYRAYEKHRQRRRSPQSPSYMRAWGDPDAAEERMSLDMLDAKERHIGSTSRRWFRLQEVFKRLPPLVASKARDLIEELCIHDRVVPAYEMDGVRVLLDHIAKEFDVQLQDRGVPSIAITARRPRRTPKREHLQREAFIAAREALQPDATPEQLAAEYAAYRERLEFAQAQTDRGRFRREKERRRRRA